MREGSPNLTGGSGAPPDSNAPVAASPRLVRVLGGATYLDSPRTAHGVKVEARIDVEGWLKIEVEADESVKGWALSFNGRDIPITVERAS